MKMLALPGEVIPSSGRALLEKGCSAQQSFRNGEREFLLSKPIQDLICGDRCDRILMKNIVPCEIAVFVLNAEFP